MHVTAGGKEQKAICESRRVPVLLQGCCKKKDPFLLAAPATKGLLPQLLGTVLAVSYWDSLNIKGNVTGLLIVCGSKVNK